MKLDKELDSKLDEVLDQHKKDLIQLNGFNDWFTAVMVATESCLMRDVLRNQKENLKQEWLKVRPMIED